MKLLGSIPKTVYFIVALIGGLSCLAVMAVAVGSSQSYRQYVLGGSRPDKMDVIIQNPQFGSQFSLATLVLVEAIADGPYPNLSMELWVDGIQVGSAQTSGEFYWPADQPGDHTLIVRATDIEGSTATSPALQLEIVGAEELAPGAAAAAYVPHSLGVGPTAPGPGAQPEPPPSLPEPPDLPDLKSIDPNTENAQPWKFGVIDWLNFVFTNPDPPHSPWFFSAVAKGCDVHMVFHDAADNEQGFQVYRDNALIATLDSSPGISGPGELLSYVDNNLFPGKYSYVISAFNKGGEAYTNSVEAIIAQQTCLNFPQESLLITLVNLQLPQFDFQIDTLYAYSAFNGEDWERTKDFYPSQDGSLPASIPITKLTQIEPGTSLDFEFWGLDGDEPHFLGSMHFEDVKNGEQGPGNDPGGGISGALHLHDLHDDDVISDDSNNPIEATTDFRIPKPFAWPAFTKSACLLHAGSAFFGGLACGGYPEDQGYTVWALSGTCPALKYNPSAQCFTEDDVLGYKVYDSQINSGVAPASIITPPPTPPPGQTFYALKNWGSCDIRQVRVTALVEINGDVKESSPSNKVYYAGHPDCAFNQGLEPRWYRLTWDTIDFSVGNIDDGVDLTDDAEGFGYLKLQTQNGFTQYWTMSEMGHSISQFGDPAGNIHANVFEFEDDAEDNPYFWSGIPLIKTTSGPCTTYTFCALGGGYSLQNHRVDFPLFVDDLAFIKVRLWDADDSHPDDVICHIPHANNPGSFGGISAAAIEGAPNSILSKSIFMGHADASCEVKFHFEPLP